MNERQKATSLKYLLNEVTSKRRISGMYDNGLLHASKLTEQDLKMMLKSGFFTLHESSALNVLFSKTQIVELNESTFSSLDEAVTKIDESISSGTPLTEGFLGDIWSGLEKLGNRAKEALVGGWNKLKTIWREFKELIEALVEVLKDSMTKMYDKGKQFATTQMNSFKDELNTTLQPVLDKLDDVAEKKKFSVEVLNAYETAKWVVEKFKQKTIDDAKWADDIIAGNGNPSETPLDSVSTEKGLQALKKEEGVVTSKKIVEYRNSLLSDKRVLSELFEFAKRRLNEAGSGKAHLEDAISNPVLKKIVSYGVKIMAWSTIPIAKLVQDIAEKKAPEVLNKMSTVVKTLGGPGAFVFPMFGLIAAELIEITIKSITPNSLQLSGLLAGIFFPPLVPILMAAEGAVRAIKMFLMVWTLGTILFNLIVSVRKAYTEWQAKQSTETGTEETGSEPEVQTAGYKPKGQFKLQEGRLIFIS